MEWKLQGPDRDPEFQYEWARENGASEVVGVGVRDGNVFVYSVHGLGFGSSVTVVVRVDESAR